MVNGEGWSPLLPFGDAYFSFPTLENFSYLSHLGSKLLNGGSKTRGFWQTDDNAETTKCFVICRNFDTTQEVTRRCAQPAPQADTEFLVSWQAGTVLSEMSAAAIPVGGCSLSKGLCSRQDLALLLLVQWKSCWAYIFFNNIIRKKKS